MSEQKQIHIEFSTGGGMISRLIRWFTWGRWSHVAIRMPEGDVIEAKEFRGVIRREVTYEQKEIVSVTVTPEQYAVFETALRSQLGKSYDWRAILGFVFRRDWERTDYWICSELVAWALKQANVNVVHEKRWRIDPTALYMYLLSSGGQIIAKIV